MSKTSVWTIAAITLGISCTFSACRTENSSSMKTSDLFTAESWIKACEEELAQSPDRERLKADLQSTTESSDCKTAYPKVRTILQKVVKENSKD